MTFNVRMIPQHRDDVLTLSCAGKSLFINGKEFDFSPMSPGDELPFSATGCAFFVGGVSCDINGDIFADMVYPCKDGDKDYVMTMLDGEVYEFRSFEEVKEDPAEGVEK